MMRKGSTKWQTEWTRAKLFEPEPDPKKKKFYMLFAYPTVSGTLHVGHARSYTIPDIIARYKRAAGFNVLFPLGFHATGVDCQRILELKDKPDEIAKYGISPDAARKFSTALDVESYLQGQMIADLRGLGLSLDYRPVVSTIHPQYNRFIQWQFRRLKKLGLLVQRDYRLAWCPKCDHPISLDPAEMDIKEWRGAQIKDYIMIKFRTADGLVLPGATLRPETVYGVTNIWVNPKVMYVKAKVNDESWIVSAEAIRKLENLDKKIKIIEEISGKELLKLEVRNPATGKAVPVLPGEFVDPAEATGIVMSVPAHDPFDFIYLKRTAPELKPAQVVQTAGFGPVPAGEILERYKIKDPTDKRIEEITKKLYKAEYSGRMLQEIPKFGGLPVPRAKVAISNWLIKRADADMIYELSVKPVHCRCDAEIVIKKIPSQWFIDYGNSDWKEKAKVHIKKMAIYPTEYKDELPAIIDWLGARPCVRRVGLGTDFPFETGWTIEALSDSTIYMAFFIISKYFNARKIALSGLTDAFFDYVLLGKGTAQEKVWEDIRREFAYWYPLDLNMIGKEHKSAHLPLFVMSHVAIFPEPFWPLGIFVNWHLVAYGKKMSKHLGNVIFLRDAIQRFGADTIRLYLCHGSNQWHDFDWRNEDCAAYGRRLNNFCQIIDKLLARAGPKEDRIERWLASRLNRTIKHVTIALDRYEIRRAADLAFFGLLADIGWYMLRTSTYSTRWIGTWLRLLAPFIPHTCEELWRKLGNKTFISSESWPEFDAAAINTAIEAEEDLIKKIIGDVDQIKRISGIRAPAKVTLVISPPWKYEIYNLVLQGKSLGEIMAINKFRELGEPVVAYVRKLERRKPLDELFLTAGSEFEALSLAREFLQERFNCRVEVLKAEETLRMKMPAPPGIVQKAAAAEPARPGILLV